MNSSDTSTNFYRPLITKLSGYSQMPRPKAALSIKNGGAKPIKATEISGLD